MKLKKSLIFVLSILLCLSAGFIGSFFTVQSITTWYQTLNKPFFNPPNYLFAPVWTILYILMGISLAFLIIKKPNQKKQKTKLKSHKKLAISFFLIQLFLNFLWSIIFFKFQNPFLALIDIILLWIFILLTIIYSYKISRTSFYLLIPYILWVSFAMILNLSIVLLN